MMSNIKRFITVVFSVMLVMCVLAFTACTPKDSVSTQPSTESTEPTTIETEPVTTENTASELTLSASYIPQKAFDATGSEVSIYTVYGSSLRDYGGSLCFKEDGTFTTFIGVYGNVNNESGTYKIISDTEIEMVYNNDTTETAVITQTDSEGNITELRMPHRNHDVVFTQE